MSDAPPPRAGEIRNVIVGTAGHIDHGKSSIVRQLTGVDPDRLAEEHERGMTIDLGFAPYRHASGATVGLIDVPGHERFIKNMVAGATSVDVALLVVAADDSVMPQTREHLEILQILGVRRGLVALNKVDLVDEDLVALAEDDVQGLLEGTFLEGSPVVGVSAVTGHGLDTLRETLDELVAEVSPHVGQGPFRMPVQRVFTLQGHGLVVTGVPVSGRVAAGDVLEVVGTDKTVRVRGIQAYGSSREEGSAGHSTALNVAGAGKEDLARGDVVAAPGIFGSHRFVALEFRPVEGVALRHRHPVRVHAGTAEIMGRAVPLAGGDDPAAEAALAEQVAAEGAPELEAPEPGDTFPVQLRLEEAVTVAPGDRLLVRDAASMQLLGGGVVLAATDGRLKRFKDRVLGDLRSRRETLGDPRRLAEAVLGAAGTRGQRADELAREVGVTLETLREQLEPSLQDGDVHLHGELYVAAEAVQQVADELVTALKHEHRARPLMDWVELTRLRSALSHAEPVIQVALAADKRLETAAGGRVRRRGHKGRLTPELEAARDRLLADLRAAGPKPPDVSPETTGLSVKDHDALVAMLRDGGELVGMGALLFHREAVDQLREKLIAHGRARDGAIVIPELRDELGTTRKYLIPILEAFDAEGLTARHGDQRVLRGAALRGDDATGGADAGADDAGAGTDG